MEEIKEETKKTKYTEAQKRAIKKYISNNRDKINEYRKKYYKHKKETDPEFLEHKRIKSKEYYNKKKGIIKEDV
jgi:hypothetical protein